jgi:Concanavalin A-like lectin/glucanases superfamily
MSHWVLLVAPLALAAFVMLFAFVGCFLDSGPYPGTVEKYEDIVAANEFLVSYWRLGEEPGSTTAVDSKGDNDGTYVGGVTLGTAGALAGNADTAALFDGVDDRVTTSFNPFQPGVARTFEGWAIRASNTSDHALFGGDAAASYPVLRCLGGGDDVRFNPDVSGAGQDFTGALSGVGEWFHWVLVWHGDTKKAALFVDGVEKGSLTYAFDFGGEPGNIELGAEGGTTNPFEGQLDEVAVYNAALDAATIKKHFELATTVPG